MKLCRMHNILTTNENFLIKIIINYVLNNSEMYGKVLPMNEKQLITEENIHCLSGIKNKILPENNLYEEAKNNE